MSDEGHMGGPVRPHRRPELGTEPKEVSLPLDEKVELIPVPPPPERQISRWGVKPSPPLAQDLALGGGPPPAHVSHVLARVPPPAFNGCEALRFSEGGECLSS